MEVTVYTDGACSRNGQKGAKAGIGVFFEEKADRRGDFRAPSAPVADPCVAKYQGKCKNFVGFQ